ncbi:hypothetical protein Tco_1279745, partial [Tanacetum coccineum]
KVLLLFAVTTSSTLALNTSTYGTISSESKWKIEWLNSTSWKRIISSQTFSPKHYQENVFLAKNTMAEQNVPTQPPTRTDEHIISVDILSNTNFFQAFTASANVPAIYLQQFWKTMTYNEKTGVYSCQVDEQWFDLSADLLRKALAITPVNPTHPFELPPSGNTVIDFVNELGKSKVREESDSTIPDPSHQTVTSTPPVIAPFTDVSSTKPSSLVTPPPINTEATTIITSLPEITPFGGFARVRTGDLQCVHSSPFS